MKCNNDVNFAVGVSVTLLMGLGLILGGVLRSHSVIAIGALCGSGTALSAFALYAIATKVCLCVNERRRLAEQEEDFKATQQRQEGYIEQPAD